MEVTVLSAVNCPAKPAFAISMDAVQGQMMHELDRPMVLPHPGSAGCSVEVELFEHLASQQLPSSVDSYSICSVPVPRPGGTISEVQLQVRRSCAIVDPASPPLPNMPRSGCSPTVLKVGATGDVASLDKEYFDRHDLHRRVQSLIQDVLRVKPDDPFRYMREQLQQQQQELQQEQEQEQQCFGATQDTKLQPPPAPPPSPQPPPLQPKTLQARGMEGSAKLALPMFGKTQVPAANPVLLPRVPCLPPQPPSGPKTGRNSWNMPKSMTPVQQEPASQGANGSSLDMRACAKQEAKVLVSMIMSRACVKTELQLIRKQARASVGDIVEVALRRADSENKRRLTRFSVTSLLRSAATMAQCL